MTLTLVFHEEEIDIIKSGKVFYLKLEGMTLMCVHVYGPERPAMIEFKEAEDGE